MKWQTIFILMAAAAAAAVAAACAPASKPAVHGAAHLSCSPVVRPLTHQLTCQRQSGGEWPYQCAVKGTLANTGSAAVTGLQVRVEYGPGMRGQRSSSFTPLGSLNGGEQVDFTSEFGYSEPPDSYDLFIECAPDLVATDVAAAKAVAATQTALAGSVRATLTIQAGAVQSTLAGLALKETEDAMKREAAWQAAAQLPAPLEPTATVAPPPFAPTEAPPPDLPPFYTPQPDAPKIFFSSDRIIFATNLDGSDPRTVAAGLPGIEYFAIDAARHMLYIARWDQSTQLLSLDFLNPGSLTIYRDGPVSGGQGLAVDPLNQEMLLGEYYSGVFAAHLGDPTQEWTQIVTSAELSPLLGQRGQLQLDPANRQVYFRTAYNGDCGACRFIYRVNYDGGGLVRITPANGGDGLVLDLSARKLYYSDLPDDSTIRRANLDGSDAETLLTLPPEYPFCREIHLDVPGQRMYFYLLQHGSGSTRVAIARAKLDGSAFEILYEMSANSEDELLGAMTLYLPGQ